MFEIILFGIMFLFKELFWDQKMKKTIRLHFQRILTAILMFFVASYAFADEVIKIGYFPNVTHAHALLMKNMMAEGKFQIPGAQIEWKAYNAGPEAMKDLVDGTIQLTYVGPTPALNTFIEQKGEGLKVLTGATRGGSALVVHKNSGLVEPKQFRGKRIATPALGNTQDISCRNWLMDAGIYVSATEKSDVEIIPTSNKELLALFRSDSIDAAWTVEPWVSRLVNEAGGQRIYTEPVERSIVTVLTANTSVLQKNKSFVQRFVGLHKKIGRWMTNNPEEAQKRIAAEIFKDTRQAIPFEIIQSAWNHIAFISYISSRDFENKFDAMKRSGFLKEVKKEDIQFENILIRRNFLY